MLTKLKYVLLGVFILSVLERGGMLVTHIVANCIGKIEQHEALPENTEESKTELSVKEYFHSTFVILFGTGQTPVSTPFIEADTRFLLDFHPPVPTPPPDFIV